MATNQRSSSLSPQKARKMANEIIFHHFNKKPLRVVQKTEGLTNFVFLAKLKEGEFVVRLSPDHEKINAYIKEQWAVSRVREKGVPAPQILEVGITVVPYPYMILQRVKGEEASNHPNRLDILFELSKYAAMINSIRTTGFGATFDWSNNQLSRNTSWKEFLSNELKIDQRLQILKKQRMLPAAKLKQLQSTLASLSKMNIKPRLNHGDLRLKNVIVDKQGKITSIIDWENCSSNYAPCWDFSIALHDLTIDEQQRFVEGYGIAAKKLREIAPYIKAINIMNYVPHIERRISKKDSNRLEQIRLRLSGVFDLYSF
jgi:hygromycin-B 4-O-kinase